MAKVIRPGLVVNGYEIIETLNDGGNATAYSAIQLSTRKKVFLKQYKSPSPTVSWYNDYMEYQGELKRRINSSSAKSFIYEFLDFFEFKHGSVSYYQAFEFMEGGHDLESVFKRVAEGKELLPWDRKLLLSKVFLSGLKQLHAVNVAHIDLKPPNVQMFEAGELGAGYKLKIIDFDASLLTDKRAPWHGDQGYIGSRNYFSPEHLSKGGVPNTSSDVFTAALMLYEILGTGNPYESDSEDGYQGNVFSDSAPLLNLRPCDEKDFTSHDNWEPFRNALKKALSPDEKKRPSIEQLHKLLGPIGAGGGNKSKPIPINPEIRTPEIIPLPSESIEMAVDKLDSEVKPSYNRVLNLTANGKNLTISIRTSIGKKLLALFGEDVKFYADEQFVIEPIGGLWYITPNLSAPNETLLNNEILLSKHPVKVGDIVGVGRKSKNIIKLPLTIG